MSPSTTVPTADSPADRPVGQHRVCARLKKMILLGHYPPGSRLIQRKLAKELDVSVTKIREALFELSGTGLVKMQADLGFLVGTLDIRRVIDTCQVRAVVDGLAARLCCERASREDVRELTEMVEQYHDLFLERTRESFEKGMQIHSRIHDRIAEITGSEPLLRARQAYYYPILDREDTWYACHEADYRRHLRIVEAIAEHRPGDAESLMRDDVQSGLDYMQERVKSGEGQLKWYYVW
jgi:DNA-binding GntR family transcriptional regulator